ncbi:MAG: hypothetical protein ACON4T_00530 [Synechococcus sp.]
MQPPSIRSNQLRVLILTSCLGGLITGCGLMAPTPSPHDVQQSKTLERLDYRLQQLERRIGSNATPPPDQGNKIPPGPVKSLTLRLGTIDDRLRIYWEDGTMTNLPCTEEQKTWVCG